MASGESGTRLQERQRRTRTRLTSAARRLTAERGLSGFLVQELCDEAGISRRTFFNYFPSKEDAVLGFVTGHCDSQLAAFFDTPPGDTHADLSPALIDDLVQLAIANFHAVGLTRDDAAEFAAALHREPCLFAALVQAIQIEQDKLVALVARREALDDRDVPEVAVAVLGALVRLSAADFFADGNTRAFDEILRSRLVAAKAVLAGVGSPSAHRVVPPSRATSPFSALHPPLKKVLVQ